MSFRYREECHGYSAGQTDCSILAYLDNKVVAHLDYASHKLNGRPEAFIKMVQVDPAFKGQGIGPELIRQLAKSIPYDAIDWGGTTSDGSALKAKMDKEFGTSFKPVEKDEEPEQYDPRYADDLDNSKFYADHDAWRKRQGYVDESRSIYPIGSRTVMKLKEFKQIVMEAMQKALKEQLTFIEEEPSALQEAPVMNPKVSPWSPDGKMFGIKFITAKGENLWMGDGWKPAMKLIRNDEPKLFPSKEAAEEEIRTVVLPYIKKWQPGYDEFIRGW